MFFIFKLLVVGKHMLNSPFFCWKDGDSLPGTLVYYTPTLYLALCEVSDSHWEIKQALSRSRAYSGQAGEPICTYECHEINRMR